MLKKIVFIIASILTISGCAEDDVSQQTKTNQYDSYKGLIMTGYQGWFNTPSDGANQGWFHYTGRNGFQPGSCSIDLWPDVSEYEKKYVSPFKFEDGSPAYLFSSYDESTVDTHFRWMKEYGIDGAFMQRFVVGIKGSTGLGHFNKVLDSSMRAADKYNRAICVMYDLSGMNSGDENILIKDIDKVTEKYSLMDRNKNPSYLYHNGKPLVGVWGVGFNDNRNYGLKEAEKIINSLKEKGFSIILGVPTFWRKMGQDAVSDDLLHELIVKSDIVFPWFVGRYDENSYSNFQQLIKEDISWTKKNNLDYVPLAFPGFSWRNLSGDQNSVQIPRNKGSFLWKQLYGSIRVGAEMIYVAMFDELDEGTAIFKCANKVPVGSSSFVPYENEIQSDHYLWLVGEAGKMLRKEIPLDNNQPKRN